ncbi:MAG: hypothetical protein LUC49_06910 [Prevotella sp.]|nr:hypothetical protein [Prevotella sp.]
MKTTKTGGKGKPDDKFAIARGEAYRQFKEREGQLYNQHIETTYPCGVRIEQEFGEIYIAVYLPDGLRNDLSMQLVCGNTDRQYFEPIKRIMKEKLTKSLDEAIEHYLDYRDKWFEIGAELTERVREIDNQERQ